MATKWEIVEGPGKYDLMTALFSGNEVIFSLAQEGSSGRVRILRKAQINLVEEELGNREDWYIEGFLVSATTLKQEFKGHYSSKRRLGTLEIS